MTTSVWLRAETKPFEKRMALTPETAAVLVEAGFDVHVERSSQGCIPAECFDAVGCTLEPEGSWRTAPRDAFILGLKELPEDGSALSHRHIHFAHAYKEQSGWKETLRRYVEGGGALYDLEFLVDGTGRRVAAFGYWAGFAGAAVAVKAWCGQQLGRTPVVPVLTDYANRDALVAEVVTELREARGHGDVPSVIVIGAHGRSGSGAVAFAAAAGLKVTEWDLEETRRGGPFDEILDHDIFVNCVLVFSDMPPFITAEMAHRAGRRLSVVSDVSCDPFGAYNPVPLYDRCTSFEDATMRIDAGPPLLDLIAIDHLPSMLPLESSQDFSRQLVASLLTLDRPDEGVWQRARDLFDTKTRNI